MWDALPNVRRVVQRGRDALGWVGRVCCAATLAVLACSSVAHGELPPTRPLTEAISVTHGKCVDASALVAAVVSQNQKSEIDSSISFEIVEQGDEVMVLMNDRGGQRSERTLSLKDVGCQKRTDAVAMIVVLAIDASFRDGAIEELPHAEGPPRLISARPPAIQQPIIPVEVPKKALLGLSLSLQGFGLFGTLPKVVGGAAAALDVTVAPWFDVRLAALGTTIATIPTGPGSATANLLSGRLDGCVAGERRFARLRGCLGALGGPVFIQGDGFVPSRSPIVPLMALAGRLDLRISITGRFGLLVSADGFVSVVRPTLDVTDLPSGSSLRLGEFPLLGASIGFGPSIHLL